MIKRTKFFQICINLVILSIGIVVIGNILISYTDVNPLTVYEFWAFGVCPIVLGGVFLQRVLQRPKIRKKKK